MNAENKIYEMPNVGCLLGTAYQILVSRLGLILKNSKLDISVPEYLILRALYTRDGMQQCEISEMIGKDKSAIFRAVNGMIKKDLVKTEAVSYKCLRVWLTPKSQSLKEEVFRIANERHKALESLCSPQELAAFNNVLRKIINN
ncbi:MAG: MarR family winged helix-turn-helix transcriptional regulator [Muribaculaceae bacterium]|nr:MarR family winged helix-turn-helix transcriptional regulator [Muribaculaceae bacterium]